MNTLTPQQRLHLLTDLNSFEPFGAGVRSRFPETSEADGDGVICGYARIGGRHVVVVVQDAAYLKGTMGEAHSNKITAAIRQAIKIKVPFIAVFNSGGARIQEGISALDPTAVVSAEMARASGVIPTVAVLLGTNAGATAYISALMDFIIMADDATMFLTGPRVIEKVTGEKTTIQQLGGSGLHGRTTGLASFVVPNEVAGYAGVKKLLPYLPDHFKDPGFNQMQKEPLDQVSGSAELDALARESKQGYDMKAVIGMIADVDSFLELQSDYAENLVTGFAMLCGLKIGIVANQPAVMSGVLDVPAAKKFFRFVQFCDAYNIPLLFLTDTPGFMPGVQEEHQNIIGAGARVLHILANSTVPKINIVTGKWIGGAYAAMCSRAMGADHVYVWNRAQIGVLGTEPALALIYDKEIQARNKNPEFIQQLREKYAETVLDPFVAAQTGLVDGVIFPHETRPLLAKLFNSLRHKAEKPVVRKRPIFPMG
jgi:acetyl-CoA carboxylase carboxyltransferase component